MENQSNRRRSAPASAPPAAAACEPEVHRWVHPIPQSCDSSAPEATLNYICCALRCQHELLCEIKTLLEQLCGEQGEERTQE